MDQMEFDQLPEVSLYAVGPKEAEFAAPLLTSEAVSLLQHDGAVGLALVEEGDTCAAICARLDPDNETVLEIISLYVTPEHRRRGLGSTLVVELLERMMEATDATIRFLTASFPANDHALTALLTKLGFVITPDDSALSWRLTLDKVSDSVLMETPAPLPPNASLRPLASLSNYQIRQLVQTLSEHDVDMLTVGQMQKAHQQGSYVLLNEHGSPTACAIFTVVNDSHMVLSQFFTAYKQPGPTLAVLQAGVKVLLEQFPPAAVLEVPTLTDSTGKLVQHLLPESQAVCLSQAVLDLTKESL